jgi:DNA-binding IclR family transcriptional regulator
MDEREEKITKVVGVLSSLEKELGGSPSVADIAERTGYSNGATYIYLREAVAKGLIAQRQERFVTLEVARAFDKKGKANNG